MEQLDVENEIVLLSDVYELKSDSSKVLIDHLVHYFEDKFQFQSKSMDVDEQMLLASAWYAICYEKNFSFNQIRLFGLPWMILDQMCLLTQYSSQLAVCDNGIIVDEQEFIVNDYGDAANMTIEDLNKLNPIWKSEQHQCLVIGVTLQLVLSWIYKIKYHIYGIRYRQSIRFLTVNIDDTGNIEANEKTINEKLFLQNFIMVMY